MQRFIRSTITLIILFSVVLVSNAQKIRHDLNTALIPEELKKDADAVIRFYNTTVVQKQNGQLTVTSEITVTVLNSNGRAYNRHTVHYNKLSSVSGFSGKLYDKSGRFLENLDKDKMADMSYIQNISVFEDTRVKTGKFSYDNYPYTVIFKYSKTLKDYLDIPNWFPVTDYNVSVQNASYLLEVQKHEKIKYKPIRLDIEPEIKETEKLTTYQWQVKNLPAIDKEPYSPGILKVIPAVLISALRIDYGGTPGNNNSWEDFGQFMYDLNEGLGELPQEAIDRINKLTDTLQSVRAKTRVLYWELQNTTRYVNISLDVGGHKSYDANYVYDNNYGDCKALTNYMRAGLKEAGIESYWALVYAGASVPDIVTDFSSSQFNHVVLAVPDENDTIWLECTSQELPFDYLGNFTGNRHALLLTPGGGKLVKTPDYLASDNYLKITATATIEQDGLARVEATFFSTGSQSRTHEHILKNYTHEEQEEWLYTQFDLPSFKIEQFLFSEPFADSAAVQLDIETELSHYVTKSGSRLFLNPNIFSRFNDVPRKVAERTMPVTKYSSSLDVDTIQIFLPAGFVIEAIPESTIAFHTVFGSYSATIELNEESNQLTYVRLFEVKRFEQPKEQYFAFRDFLKKVSKSDQRQIVLKKKD